MAMFVFKKIWLYTHTSTDNAKICRFAWQYLAALLQHIHVLADLCKNVFLMLWHSGSNSSSCVVVVLPASVAAFC